MVLDAAAPGDAALVAYTSGTTGAPKGAVLTHANLLANSESIAVTWRWHTEDRLVHALPIFHGHGLCVALYTSLLTGSSVVLLPRFDVDAVLDACVAHRATMFFGVPTMYHRLAGSSRVGELARLRLAVSGSAPLSAELHRAIAETAGVEVLERYGMTETLMTLSNPYDGERRPGTVGFPFPGVEAEVGEGGGEVLVRGPAVFSGYWERPRATAESFAGGWFRTGDLGVVEDGYVRLLGRSTEVIISGGFNVYPAEVEDVLLGHPSVAEVAVTGVPSDGVGRDRVRLGRPRRHVAARRRRPARLRGATPRPLQAAAPCAPRRLVAAQLDGQGPSFGVAVSAGVRHERRCRGPGVDPRQVVGVAAFDGGGHDLRCGVAVRLADGLLQGGAGHGPRS